MKKLILGIFILFISTTIFFVSNSRAQVSGLVAHWDFEGSGNQVLDTSGNNNHGTIVGGAVRTTGRIGNYSMSFDGVDDYIDIPNGWTNTIAGDDTHTISLWFNLDELQNSRLISPSIGYRYNTQLWYGGKFYWSTGGGTNKEYLITLTPDEWRHIALVKTGAGDSGNLYIDGVLQTPESGILVDTPTDNMDLYIGKFGNSGYEFKGLIDDVRIYNYALSASEIQTIMNDGTPIPPNPTTCITFTYNSWGICQSSSTQTRTVNTSSPSGCTGGSPVTTQSCVYVPPTGGVPFSCTTYMQELNGDKYNIFRISML